MKTVAILILGVGSLALAQEAKPPVKAYPPTISAELRADLFKSEALLNQAQITLKNAQEDLPVKQQAFQATVQKLTAVCGKFNLQLDNSGDPVCVAPPETPKPATETKPALKK